MERVAVSADEAESVQVGSYEGMKAPDLSLPLLDGDGEVINLYEQVDKYDAIILYFFYAATWPSCSSGWMPEIQKELDGRYQGQNVQAFGISIGDPEWYMRAFKEQLGCTFLWLSMDISLPNPYYRKKFEAYRLVEDAPTLIVLDTSGIIRFKVVFCF